MLLSSCNSDEETPAPTIRLKNPPATTAEKGSTVSFPIEVIALEKIESIRISKKLEMMNLPCLIIL